MSQSVLVVVVKFLSIENLYADLRSLVVAMLYDSHCVLDVFTLSFKGIIGKFEGIMGLNLEHRSTAQMELFRACSPHP